MPRHQQAACQESLQDMRRLRSMEKFFPAEKIIMTGNPVRQNLLGHSISRVRSRTLFRLRPRQKNNPHTGRQSWSTNHQPNFNRRLDIIRKNPDIQFIWQTGKIYIAQVRDAITTATGEAVHHPHISALPNLYVTDFIKDMANA